MRCLFLLLALFVCGPASMPVSADSWLMPKVETTYSANKTYRFVTTPRNVESQLAYFRAKAEGRDLPPAPPPQGRLERLIEGKWIVVWQRDLVNEVAPVVSMVSDDGNNIVTFDNWASVGYGKNVVVIYGPGGSLVRSLQLDQLMPAFFVGVLPHSVSSIWWRASDPAITDGSLEIPIKGPGSLTDKPAAFVARVSLANGAVEPISSDKLAALAPRFCAAHIAEVRAQNDGLAYERNDLVLPAADDKDDWSRFQFQVVRRTKPAARQGELDDISDSPFELLAPDEYMAEAFAKLFRDALTDKADDNSIRWFSARNLEQMAEEIEHIARKIRPAQLNGVELRFLTDTAHWPRIQSAMAPSGAMLVFVNINQPVPQRAEVLAKLPPEEHIDPTCVQFAM